MMHTEEGLMERLRNNGGQVPRPPSNVRLLRDPPVGGQSLRDPARSIYFALLKDHPDDLAMSRSRAYLTQQLEKAASCDSDLPENLDELQAWSDTHTRQVGEQYRQYLKARKDGRDRRYFTNKSHALYFLMGVAPTKLVDGAWLHGLLQQWRDPRFLPLIQTYLEELGDGIAEKNHVVIYKKLLAAHGCLSWDSSSDAHFVQGAIQLALGQHTGNFLPEVIGYNLGYEQLPLHLLISAYELNELGIDPYYFTLHVTIDNAATGHARHAVQAVFEALPHFSEKQAFYRRVVNGYKLNTLGASTNTVISQFDLEQELIAVLTAKAGVGAQLHSDYCKIAGKTVNTWLSEPDQLPLFIEALQQHGWILRHQDPQASRFWKLIQGDQAQMFGVFTAYEKQVIYDWIAGDSAPKSDARPISFRARQGLARSMTSSDFTGHTTPRHDDFDEDLRLLEQKLAGALSKDDAMALLIKLASPAHHHTAPGLMATRAFARLLHGA